MKKLKTATIYAHYNAKNQIDNACLINLKGLKEISDNLIFVTTSNLPKIEIDKIKPYCSMVKSRENIALDFGSYAVGLKMIKANQYDNIIFTNDSVYGPIYPLKETFSEAQKSSADIYGITLSQEKKPHIQSYFMLFKQNVINSSTFQKFWNRVSTEIYENKSKQEIIQDYEIGLSEHFQSSGFTISALYEDRINLLQKIYIFICKTEFGFKLFRLKKLLYKKSIGKDIGFNPTHILAEELIKKHKIPYIKKELIEKNPYKLKLSKYLLDIVSGLK